MEKSTKLPNWVKFAHKEGPKRGSGISAWVWLLGRLGTFAGRSVLQTCAEIGGVCNIIHLNMYITIQCCTYVHKWAQGHESYIYIYIYIWFMLVCPSVYTCNKLAVYIHPYSYVFMYCCVPPSGRLYNLLTIVYDMLCWIYWHIYIYIYIKPRLSQAPLKMNLVRWNVWMAMCDGNEPMPCPRHQWWHRLTICSTWLSMRASWHVLGWLHHAH